MKVIISDPILVHAPEMTEEISRWGVYAIPRMWRIPDGRLIIRFNGEEDNADKENMQRVPNLYFVSDDNGISWHKTLKSEDFALSVLTGIDPPYKKLSNDDIVYLKYGENLSPIKNIPWQSKFISPCKDAVIKTYHWGDLTDSSKKIYFGRIDKTGKEKIEETNLDFPERLVHVVSEANSNGEFIKVEEYLQPFIFRLPFFSALCETKEGDLVGVCVGQNPEVSDKSYCEVYLVASEDCGKTFRKRSVVAGGVSSLPYGFGGDGWEVSLTVDRQGTLFCVMRMDMSSNPLEDPHETSTYFCYSNDSGFTWSSPKPIADSSVTPHVISLGEALLLIYGRPGVHAKISCDKGETWSEAYSIIGKTLTEERMLGRNDFESKYLNPYSYCNTFYEKISDNEIILLYNDLRYKDKNGNQTKAAFVRKIKVLE